MSNLVVAAALRISEEGVVFSLPRPNRHHNIIHALHAIQPKLAHGCEQGFLLADGTFANRERALRVAYAAGQLEEKNKVGHKDLLFSEDLW